MAVTGFNGINHPGSYFTNWAGFHQPNLTIDNNGTYYSVPKPQLYITTENSYVNLLGATTPSRQVQIDFTNSPLIVNNLGLGLNILQGNVTSTVPFQYNALSGIDFANWYDLGLDILNLNLETYVGYSNGVNSGKKNTLAYFLAQRIADSSNLFHWEEKQMVFLSILNKETLNISSLQFRIYDINTGLAVNLTAGSFNIFITNERKDRLDISDFQKRLLGNVY
jgi:hypothetical protein